MAELTKMIRVSIGELEDQLGVQKWPLYARACEQVFQDRIGRIAGRIAAEPEIRAVFVSGPTASGKTTFADRLAQALYSAGRRTRLISLDDYYKTGDILFDSQGRPDYESIDTLETDHMVSDFAALLAGRTVQLPTFDFVQRRQIVLPEKKIVLDDGDLILVEGLHGLSGLVAGHLPRRQILGIFIMPWCTLLDGRQLLGSRDLRILRRISRDVLHRGSTALSTLDYWPMIDQTEQQFFPPYLARADEYVNSCLPYEFCVVAPLAAAQIRASLEQYELGWLPGSIYRNNQQGYADLPSAVEEARDLLKACRRIPVADTGIVPEQSILREFIE
ncbi:MAG: hypothetical protein VB070_15560 [Clostridiaceae bacterium]|nr:hypothetical protein [Clostridiaceae bacterium]